MMATGRDFGSVCSTEQSSAACHTQAQFSSIDRSCLSPFHTPHVPGEFAAKSLMGDLILSGWAQNRAAALLQSAGRLVVVGLRAVMEVESSVAPGCELGTSTCWLSCLLQDIFQQCLAGSLGSCLEAFLETVLCVSVCSNTRAMDSGYCRALF